MACLILLGLTGCGNTVDTLSYVQLREKAMTAGESAAFSIGWRVCGLPESEQTQLHGYWIQYDLVLVPRYPMQDVHFTAYLPEKAAAVLVNAQWHNEPQTIAEGALYTWNPCVRIERETPLDAICLSDFTEMVLEIRWKGGREIVFVDENSTLPENWQGELEPYLPLSEREIEIMKHMVKEAE